MAQRQRRPRRGGDGRAASTQRAQGFAIHRDLHAADVSGGVFHFHETHTLPSFGVDAQIVGRVEASSNKKLTIESEFGKFEYI